MTATLEPSNEVVALSRRGRRWRTVSAAIALLLITVGTVHGTDDDFPFGPLRMYSTRDDPNGQISQAVVEAHATNGSNFDVTNTAGAPRRAELEGRFAEFSSNPTAFNVIGPQYVTTSGRIRGHSSSVVLDITLVRRVYQLRDGRRSGPAVDQVIATWIRR